MKTPSRFLHLLASGTVIAALPLSGDPSRRKLSAADPAKVESTEKALNLGMPGMRSRGASGSSTLEGGYRLRGFNPTARGGLPPSLQDYTPGITHNMGPLAQGGTPAEKQASTQAIANAADLAPFNPKVDTKSESKLNDIQFGIDTADFTDEDKALADLAVIAAAMEHHPEARLLIRGHTCDLGDAQYNLVLSCMRANKVWAWLVANGISTDRLDALGYGEQLPKEPIIENSTEAEKGVCRALNRRVFFQLQMPRIATSTL